MTTTEQKFDIYTATPAEVEAHIEATMRAHRWNFVRKAKALSDAKFRLTSDGQLMHGVIFFAGQDRRSPDVIAAHRRYVEAEARWLEANPGDDVDATRIALLTRMAREGLPHATALRGALSWVVEVENNCLGIESSETRKCLERKFADACREVAEYLGDMCTRADVEFLAGVNGRSWRFARRFRFERNLWIEPSALATRDGMRLVDIHLPGGVGRLFAKFENLIGQAATLNEVKRLCEIWRSPVTVTVRDGAKVVTGEGFEIVPV